LEKKIGTLKSVPSEGKSEFSTSRKNAVLQEDRASGKADFSSVYAILMEFLRTTVACL
jgi:hypothetical protein